MASCCLCNRLPIMHILLFRSVQINPQHFLAHSEAYLAQPMSSAASGLLSLLSVQSTVSSTIFSGTLDGVDSEPGKRLIGGLSSGKAYLPCPPSPVPTTTGRRRDCEALSLSSSPTTMASAHVLESSNGPPTGFQKFLKRVSRVPIELQFVG